MPYQALYRKYRPQTFDAVIGQDHITTILKNQVQSGHVAHAYLFSGTRGTGKTTTARIFARALNCLSPRNGEPCGTCEACLVSAGENADIIELDAASNSSVEDIRSLVEKARYTPLLLKTKVYIIDEAHALASSSQAFNALLKTLEEPPAHVVFILATTEPQKLPATIRSRCQRLDFHRLRVGDMVRLMEDLLQKSGASIEREGLLAIARAADGGMRDALSLADQCLAFCGDHINTEDVYRVLGSMDGAFFFAMADALIGGDAHAALTLLDKVIGEGRDLTVFTHDLTLHMRALLISKLCGESGALLDCTPEDARRYLEQSGRCGEERLLGAVELLTAMQGELKWLASPRARVEAALVRIAKPEAQKTLGDLVARIELLEGKLAGAIAPSPAQDAPPWDETPKKPARESVERPVKKEKPTPIQAPAARPAPPAQPEAAQTAGGDWQAALGLLKQRDLALYAMALRAKAETRDGAVILRFEKDIFQQAMQKNQAVLEEVLGCPVRFDAAAAQTPEARARALFGTDLKIID